jgi:sulfatase modifying factor 1
MTVNARQAALATRPNEFPLPWASDWGVDPYGLWMGLVVGGVRQAFRWIPPGRFLMGSPPDEAERLDDEMQHEVILSEGFWLAETACTQALWEAVMDRNPSYFKGAERPVEWVNWEEAIAFIERLNAQVDGLNLRLPTEAQWEYACRAGTRTPFWFGDNITANQVNYDGNYPYAGGKKGGSRGETVEAKSLPCNGWGLYQMHGNVWEWCSDWFGQYPESTVTDPVGTELGEGRVLRGGSWNDYGRDARSALRSGYTPVYRIDFIGFRLARGQSGQQAGNQAARGTGQAARSDDGQARAIPGPRLKEIFKKK